MPGSKHNLKFSLSAEFQGLVCQFPMFLGINFLQVLLLSEAKFHMMARVTSAECFTSSI